MGKRLEVHSYCLAGKLGEAVNRGAIVKVHG